jgi:hypothetical protein
MKNLILLLTIFVVIVLTTGCEDLRDGTFYYENDFNYYPQKDTFTRGDTLWLIFSIPKNIKNYDFDVTFDEDSLVCEIIPSLNKITNVTDTSYIDIASIAHNYDLYFKKGSSIPHNPTFYFVWDNESQKYVTEFGFILQDTGKLMINGNGYKEYFMITIEKRINERLNTILPSFHSTFKTTGKGWFEFEVVE